MKVQYGKDVASHSGPESCGATVLQATPATWRLLFERGWTGDRRLKVLVGGEALSPQLARRLVASCGEVWNMYGPTETPIWSSIYRVERHDEHRIISVARELKIRLLYALCHPDNRASARVLEKCGFLFEQRLENFLEFPNLSSGYRDDCLRYVRSAVAPE